MPHDSGVVLWFHFGRPCVCLSIRQSSIFSFPDDNLSKHQWIFTKLGMCIDIVKIWFGIAYGQILSKLFVMNQMNQRTTKQGGHALWKTGKTGKMVKKNSLQGKIREFEILLKIREKSGNFKKSYLCKVKIFKFCGRCGYWWFLSAICLKYLQI